jgi:hypothetical protein
MVKSDCDNANKIPDHPSAWCLQWLFLETKIFCKHSLNIWFKSGYRPFDCAGFLLVLIAATTIKIPKILVFQTPDDMPGVSPYKKITELTSPELIKTFANL